MTNKVYRVDQCWFNIDEKRIVGDMASTFGDCDESRVDSYGELIREVDSALVDMYKEDKASNDSIRVLELERGEIDEDDWQPKDGWDVLAAVCVCTKEEAEKTGLIDEVKKYYKKYTFIDESLINVKEQD